MPPEGGGGGDIPLGAEKRRWHHDRASLISSWYDVPPVRRSPRCAWGWGVAWDTWLPHKTLLQPPNAGTAEPFRVSSPEVVAYPLELATLVRTPGLGHFQAVALAVSAESDCLKHILSLQLLSSSPTLFHIFKPDDGGLIVLVGITKPLQPLNHIE